MKSHNHPPSSLERLVGLIAEIEVERYLREVHYNTEVKDDGKQRRSD
jgi:hypothetical protein